MKRILPILLAAGVLLVGLTRAEDPPAGQDEPPLRLDRKSVV